MTKKETTMKLKNQKFWALSQAEQRVAIAKDVIKQVKSKWLLPTKGDYFEFYNLPYDLREKKIPKKLDTLFNTIKKDGGTCTACGIGACFASLVMLGDKAEALSYADGDKYDNIDILQDTSISDSSMRKLLRKVFEPHQLTLIECAFEKSDSMRDHEDRKRAFDPTYNAAEFGRQHINAYGRMIAIMENIIANKGTFIP